MFISRFYDKMMAGIERKCLRQWRQSLLSTVSGQVLEIGAGTGANLVFYSDKVEQLILSEPDDDMRKQLKQKIVQSSIQNITVNNYKAESLLIAENSLDYVVSTLVCCSVKDLQGSLNEINRVLKPGGRYIFMEHVAASDGSRCRRWQNRINPFWKRMAGNCHLYPCSLEMQDFRVSVENQVKASLEGNDGSFTRAITQDWVSTEAPVGQA